MIAYGGSHVAHVAYRGEYIDHIVFGDRDVAHVASRGGYIDHIVFGDRDVAYIEIQNSKKQLQVIEVILQLL